MHGGGSRKRVLGTRRPIALPEAANQRRSVEFLSDTATDGRPLRVPCMVDDFTRESLMLVADMSLPSSRDRGERPLTVTGF